MHKNTRTKTMVLKSAMKQAAARLTSSPWLVPEALGGQSMSRLTSTQVRNSGEPTVYVVSAVVQHTDLCRQPVIYSCNHSAVSPLQHYTAV